MSTKRDLEKETQEIIRKFQEKYGTDARIQINSQGKLEVVKQILVKTDKWKIPA